MDDVLTWVINLDRAPQRMQRVAARLDELGLPFVRLPAFDGRALTPDQQGLLDAAAFQRKHGMTPVPNELGCYLSHVEALRRFVASNARYALVLEDDVQLTDRLPTALRGLVRQAARWDMVKLTAVHSGTPVRVHEVAPGQHLAVMLTRCTGASAYLVNRRAAEAYVQGLLPMELPYDHVFDQGWRFGLKVRLLTPTPCIHDEVVASTIAAPVGATRKFHWTRRGSTYRYRLGNEWQRLCHGLAELWRERALDPARDGPQQGMTTGRRRD